MTFIEFFHLITTGKIIGTIPLSEAAEYLKYCPDEFCLILENDQVAVFNGGFTYFKKSLLDDGKSISEEFSRCLLGTNLNEDRKTEFIYTNGQIYTADNHPLRRLFKFTVFFQKDARRGKLLTFTHIYFYNSTACQDNFFLFTNKIFENPECFRILDIELKNETISFVFSILNKYAFDKFTTDLNTALKIISTIEFDDSKPYIKKIYNRLKTAKLLFDNIPADEKLKFELNEEFSLDSPLR